MPGTMAADGMRAVLEDTRVRALVLGALALVGASLLLLGDPHAADSWLPPCPFHALTGWFCPGCGTTRALHALLHGQPMLALSMNPLAVLALPLLPLLALRNDAMRTGWLQRAHGLLVDARGWLVLVLAFALLRNLPFAPFVALAPG